MRVSVQERDDLPAAVRGSRAHGLGFGSRHFKSAGQAGMVCESQNVLHAELVNRQQRANLKVARRALQLDHRIKGICIQPDYWIGADH